MQDGLIIEGALPRTIALLNLLCKLITKEGKLLLNRSGPAKTSEIKMASRADQFNGAINLKVTGEFAWLYTCLCF